MVSTFEAAMSLMAACGRADEAAAMRRTVHWVRVSCRDDGLPDWLVAMVVHNVETAFLRSDPSMPVLPVQE